MKARPILGYLKILNFNIHLLLLLFFFGGGGGGGGFRKLNHYGECRFCGYFLGVITKLDYFWGSFLCIYRSFLSSMYRTGIFFEGCLFVVVVVVFGGVGVNSRSLV